MCFVYTRRNLAMMTVLRVGVTEMFFDKSLRNVIITMSCLSRIKTYPNAS